MCFQATKCLLFQHQYPPILRKSKSNQSALHLNWYLIIYLLKLIHTFYCGATQPFYLFLLLFAHYWYKFYRQSDSHFLLQTLQFLIFLSRFFCIYHCICFWDSEWIVEQSDAVPTFGTATTSRWKRRRSTAPSKYLCLHYINVSTKCNRKRLSWLIKKKSLLKQRLNSGESRNLSLHSQIDNNQNVKLI